MMSSNYFMVGILSASFISYAGSSHDQCNVIIHTDLENCRNRSQVDKTNHQKLGLHRCKNTSICDREFKISFVQLHPYYEWRDLLTVMIDFCCGRCAQLTIENEFTDNTDLDMKTLATSDFVYPILAPTKAFQLFGFYFIPIIDAPSVFYITASRVSPKETVLNMVKACAELWPMFLVCILLAAISGFFVWLAETWKNENEFSRSFFIGLFDGFWWAFVSMTTVGYGDKIPKTWRARSVAVIWILTGITMVSLFTASLTGKIISGLAIVDMSMQGKKVGWLKPRLFEAKIIAHNGGRIVAVHDLNYITGIKTLLGMLNNGTIHGFVLDKNMYNLYKLSFTNRTDAMYDAHIEHQFFHKTHIKEVFHKGEKLSFGLLVRNSLDNKYFRQYFIDNNLQVKSCNMLGLNSDRERTSKEINLFTLEAGLFWPSFGVCLGALACIFGFGFFYEAVRLQVNVQLRRTPFMRRKDRSVGHTTYQKNWIDLVTSGERVVGTNRAEDITQTKLKNELSKQGISVLYLDNCDVLLFDQSEIGVSSSQQL